jgi:hypothetical protein
MQYKGEGYKFNLYKAHYCTKCGNRLPFEDQDMGNICHIPYYYTRYWKQLQAFKDGGIEILKILGFKESIPIIIQAMVELDECLSGIALTRSDIRAKCFLKTLLNTAKSYSSSENIYWR